MLTPTEIENKMFKKVSFGGYSIDEVEEFLEKIILDYEVLYKENVELKNKCDTMNESLEYFKSIEEGINQTVDNVTEEAEKMINEAMSEVEYIKDNKEAILREQLTDISKVIAEKEIEFERLVKQMELYKIKIASMLEAQLKIIKGSEECE